MKKYCKALVNLGLAAGIFLAILLLLPRLIVFFAPFVAGWIVALIAGPLVRFFEEKIKLKRKIGGAFVIIVVIAAVVLILYFVIAKLVEEAGGLISALPEMWEGMETDLGSIGQSLSVVAEKLPENIQEGINNTVETVGEYMGDLLGRISTPTIAAAGNLAKQLPSIFIGIIMALLSSYFFVAERDQINEWFEKHTPAALQLRYRMMHNSLVKSVGGYFKAQFKIEVWMYLLLLLGLGILHVNYFGLIALVIAFMDFLPFLGTGTILIPWAIVRILTGNYQTAVGLLIIWGVGQLARQLIQPKIVGDSMGVAPLPTLFLLYIGYKVGGVVGMIIAVPLGILVYSMYQEGAFDTLKKSVLILTAGINRFRRIGQEDLFEVDEMNMRNEAAAKEVEESRAEMERMKEEERLARQQKREARKKRP
jgi:sporulation integral membrane protein YtvI